MWLIDLLLKKSTKIKVIVTREKEYKAHQRMKMIQLKIDDKDTYNKYNYKRMNSLNKKI